MRRIQRMEMMREKAQLSRSISHPAGMAIDPRVPHAPGYYPSGAPVMTADPAMQHAAAIRHQCKN